MNKLLNPRLLFFINTLPVVLMAFILYGHYNIIQSQLPPESTDLWKTGSLFLAIISCLTLLYALVATFFKKEIPIVYGFLALIANTLLLYWVMQHSDKIIPRDIPAWMFSDADLIKYSFTFIMPSLAHALFILVMYSARAENEPSVIPNIAVMVLVPVFVFAIISGMMRGAGREGEQLLMIIMVAGTILFLFALVRTIYIISVRRANTWSRYSLVWKIPVAILLPLLGLAVNSGLLFGSHIGAEEGIFANFSHIGFYILAALNGIFICLPSKDNYAYRWLLFIARSITFTYTFYFFIVFLPFLPLSVLALVAIGIGFLMLVPLVLFVVHINVLADDYRYLRNHTRAPFIALAFAASITVLPLAITWVYWQDKVSLETALEYAYYPDYHYKYDIDKKKLDNTLRAVSHHKDRNDFFFDKQTPYLSSYYTWLVLDNMTLSDDKMDRLESIFTGSVNTSDRDVTSAEPTVNITDLKTTSRYDATQDAWISQVDLQLTSSHSETWRQQEYATSFHLPVGCWISDYYLYTTDTTKEYGLLAEKKAAMWIYQQIKDYRRDPGILYYLSGNKVRFRVFPFENNQTRKTGIEFIHKEPVTIELDGREVQLGTKEPVQPIATVSSNDKTVTYVSAAEKAKLKEVEREPYFHFIIDLSRNTQDTDKVKYERLVDSLFANGFFSPKNAIVTFANTYTTTVPLDANWKKELAKQTCTGGFYLDKAMKEILLSSWEEKSKKVPVIAVLTDDFQDAILEDDYSEFEIAYPEGNWFYVCDYAGHATAHSFLKPWEAKDDLLRGGFSVLAWPDEKNPQAYLRDDGKPSLVLKEFATTPVAVSGEKNWATGLALQGRWQGKVFYPKAAEPYWTELVKGSFESKIMTPQTSYLVVENEAQKQMLKKKQLQAMSGNEALDLGEKMEEMSEPPLWLLMALLLAIGGVRYWIQRRRLA